MSWQETNSEQEKLKFINDWLKKEFTFSALCKRYGISRPTGYLAVNRYISEGVAGLLEQSRAPHVIPHKTPASITARLLELKYRFPSWGPKAIKHYLIEENIPGNWPAASTIGEIFLEHGLVKPRKLRKKSPPHSAPLQDCKAPNQSWSADFKGQFKIKNGKYCYPLTITDNFSRYLIMCEGLLSPNCDNALRCYENAFREYGLPDVIRTDNGQPFAGVGLGGLTRLSIWLLKLDIMPERISLGCPQQNGRHERMHRTLKAAAIIPKKYSLIDQQEIFDNFKTEFNTMRPHQALGMKRPSEFYQKSIRQMPDKIPEISYPDNFLIRKVRSNGETKFLGDNYYISELLCKETIGLELIDETRAIIYFGRLKLGMIDARLKKIIRP